MTSLLAWSFSSKFFSNKSASFFAVLVKDDLSLQVFTGFSTSERHSLATRWET